MALNVSSARASELILAVGLDPTDVIGGSKRASDALSTFEAKANTTGRRIPIVNEKLTALSNTMFALTGVSGGAGRAMSLVAHSANLLQQATMGLVSGWGLALSAVTVLGVGLYNLFKSEEEATTSTKKLKEEVSASVQPFRLLTDTMLALSKSFDQAGSAARILTGQQIEKMTAELKANEQQLARVTEQLSAYGIKAGEAKAQQFSTEVTAQGRAAGVAYAEYVRLTQVVAELRAQLEGVKKAATTDPIEAAFGGMANTARRFSKMQLSLGQLKPFQFQMLNFGKDDPVLDEIKKSRKEWEKTTSAWAKDARLKGAQIAGTLSDQLAQFFLSGAEGFDNMLKGWAAKLASSAIFKLLMGIFNPLGSIIPIPAGDIPVFQSGTSFVPNTGLAMLHRGEAVVPAGQNIYNHSITRSMNEGANQAVTINVYPRDTDPLVLARKLETLVRRRQVTFAPGT